jgi:hypothetical protein
MWLTVLRSVLVANFLRRATLMFGEDEARMLKAEEYRQRAAACRRLAHSMQNEAERDELLRMADAWERFAYEREKRAAKEAQER